jgi:hypothetical protein
MVSSEAHSTPIRLFLQYEIKDENGLWVKVTELDFFSTGFRGILLQKSLDAFE